MTEHLQYKAIGHQTEQTAKGTRHKVWVEGCIAAYMVPGAEYCVQHGETTTLSHETETEIWFLNQVPFWIILPEAQAS